MNGNWENVNLPVIHAEMWGNKTLIPRAELERPFEIARVTEPVEFEIASNDSADNMMRMADEGKSFDFWLAPEVNIYSAEDGEPV